MEKNAMDGRFENSQRYQLERGQIVFEEGDRGNSVYLIEQGAIDIVKRTDDEPIRLATLRAGEMFGEMAVIDGSRRMATAIAAEPSIVLRIPADLIEQKLTRFDPFMQALVRILVRNLREVHWSYMKRPRSVHDHLRAMLSHSEKVERYIRILEDPPLKAQAGARLETVDGLLDDLSRLFADHHDPRRSILDDAQLGE